MSGFEPFQEFRDRLEEGGEANETREPEVVHSYLDDDGGWIDCVRAGTQPGLRGGAASASPPAFIATSEDQEGARSAPAASTESKPHRVDRLGNAMICPEGCIPVRRADRNRPGSTGTGERFFEKGPGGGALPPTP